MRVLSKCAVMACLAIFACFGYANAQSAVEPITNPDLLKLQQLQQAETEPQTDEELRQFEEQRDLTERQEEQNQHLQEELRADIIANGYYPIPGWTYTGNPDVDADAFRAALNALAETNPLLYLEVKAKLQQ